MHTMLQIISNITCYELNTIHLGKVLKTRTLKNKVCFGGVLAQTQTIALQKNVMIYQLLHHIGNLHILILQYINKPAMRETNCKMVLVKGS